MKEKIMTIPEIGMVAATRAALGVGVGFLLSHRLNEDQRKGAGWALFGLGVLSTIPLAVNLFRKRPLTEKLLALAS